MFDPTLLGKLVGVKESDGPVDAPGWAQGACQMLLSFSRFPGFSELAPCNHELAR